MVHSFFSNKNNRWTTPQSSEISLEYEGKAIKRNEDDKTVETVVTPNNGVSNSTWYFDTRHSKLTNNKDIPESMKKGVYANKSDIEPNEEFNGEWLRSIVSLDDEPFNSLGGYGEMNQALVQGLNGFGITHEYTIRIRNMSSKTRKFSYVKQGQDCKVNYSINGEKVDLGVTRVPSWVENSVEVFSKDIVPGEETLFNIQITLMTGSNPTMHNSFIIDGNIKEKTVYENEQDKDNSPYYSGKLFDNLNGFINKKQ